MKIKTADALTEIGTTRTWEARSPGSREWAREQTGGLRSHSNSGPFIAFSGPVSGQSSYSGSLGF